MVSQTLTKEAINTIGGGNEGGSPFLRPRYYDPTIGRFTKLDPFKGVASEPLTLHKYVYCHNDPVNRIDPSGELSFSLSGLMTSMTIGAALGAITGGSAAVAYNVRNDVTMFSREGVRNLLIGTVGGAVAGALLGGVVYAGATGLLQSGASQLLAKLAMPHSRTASAALVGFGAGLVAGMCHPEIEKATGISGMQGLWGSAGLTTLVAGWDVLTRGLMRNRDALITVFGAAGYQSARTILFTYVQSSTFMSLGALIGFTAGYGVGYNVRTYVIEPLIDAQ